MTSGHLAMRTVAYDSPEAQELVTELNAELSRRYGGEGDASPVSAAQFAPPSGTFFVLEDESGLLGCAGVRTNGADCELKRMYVRPERRGEGLSRRLLTAVEEYVRDRGISRVILETGTQQPEAMRLYETSGYEPIPGFGYYADEPLSRCYAKWLR